ncbi:unnamed protein product [Rotaria sp. Silwood1]|nr:unnamed protein product [Rotaria sp. Silwood1]
MKFFILDLGTGFNVNQHYFSFTINACFPICIRYGCLSQQIIFGASFSMGYQEDLDNLLFTSPVAFGLSINEDFQQQEKDKQC